MSDRRDHGPTSGANWWRLAAVVTAAALFWVAISDVVYELTSPPSFSLHVLLRKAYSIAAFALVGFLADKSLGAATNARLRDVLVVAAYSACIELGQRIHGSHEGLAWNAVDVLCGAAGGWLGFEIARITRSRRRA